MTELPKLTVDRVASGQSKQEALTSQNQSFQNSVLMRTCARCGHLFDIGVGYISRDSFYCEDCVWILADAGEFCS